MESMNSKFYIDNTLYFLIVVERLAMQMHLQGAFLYARHELILMGASP